MDKVDSFPAPKYSFYTHHCGHVFCVYVGSGVGQCSVFNQQVEFYQNQFVLAIPGQFQLIRASSPFKVVAIRILRPICVCFFHVLSFTALGSENVHYKYKKSIWKQAPPHIIFSEVVPVLRHYLLLMHRKGILREILPNAMAGEVQSIGYIELEYAVTHWYKKSN